jgi:hypothetical protein
VVSVYKDRKFDLELKSPPAAVLIKAFRAASAVRIDDLTSGDLDGAAIGREIGVRRLAALREYKTAYEPPK